MKILIVTWMAIVNALVSASYVRNMHNGKTCVEAGYKDITSRSQCESAFRLVPKHPEKKSSSSHSVTSTSLWGGCMSTCFSDYSGYFCRSWGSKEVQGKTDKSANIYMLCMLPATTTQGSQGCEDWCFKDKAAWTEKCKWSACDSCAACNAVITTTRGVTRAPETPRLDFERLALGSKHSFVLKRDGSAWATGRNDVGQLGDGSTTDRRTFVKVVADNVTSVAAGSRHSFLLKKDSSVWAAGENKFGQLGDGSTTDRTSFVQVSSDGKAMAAGYSHSLMLKQDGSAWAAGWNYYGQLGTGGSKTIPRRRFVQVYTGVQAVAAGDETSFLLMEKDGSVWATGKNDYGQLGHGSTTDQSNFVKVIPSGAQAVAAGDYHSVVLKQDGSVWTTGDNNNGQLGDGGKLSSSSRFIRVISSGVQAVAAGFDFVLVLKQDSTVWATGKNNYGQLGDGSKTKKRQRFIEVATGVKAVAAGHDHSLLRKHDESVWAAGFNKFGQLGDGQAIDKTDFVKVVSVARTRSQPPKLYATRRTLKSNDIQTDEPGALPRRTLKFTKTSANSLMKMTYADNFRVIGRDQWCSWTIKVDGKDCPIPIYNSKRDSTSTNDHTPHVIVGTCAGIVPGSHTMTIVLTRNTGADCYTGWSPSSARDAFFLEAEELNPAGQITSVTREEAHDARESGVITGRRLIVDKQTAASQLRITWSTNLRVRSLNNGGAKCDWEVLIDGKSCLAPSKIGVSMRPPRGENEHVPVELVGWCQGIQKGSHSITVMVTKSSSDSTCETGWGTNDYMEVWEPTQAEQALVMYMQKANTNSASDASSSLLTYSFTKRSSYSSVRILYYDNLRVEGNRNWCRWEVKVDGMSCAAPLAASIYHYPDDNDQYPVTILGECLGVSAGKHKINIALTNSAGAKCHTGWTPGTRAMHALIEVHEVVATQEPECNVANSDKQPGLACTCLPGYWGNITWNVKPIGACTKCTEIFGCAAMETCSTAADQQCSRCEDQYDLIDGVRDECVKPTAAELYLRIDDLKNAPNKPYPILNLMEATAYDKNGNRLDPVFSVMSSAHPSHGVVKCHELQDGGKDTGFCRTAGNPKPDPNPWLVFGYLAGPRIGKIVIKNRNQGGTAHTEFNERIAGATISISWDKAGTDVLWSGKFNGVKDTYTWTLPHVAYMYNTSVYYHRPSGQRPGLKLRECQTKVAALFESMTCFARMDSPKNSVEFASNSSADISALTNILGSYRNDLFPVEICRAGYRTDGQAKACVPCEAGYFASVGGLRSCSRCLKGHVSAKAASVCEKCLPGKYAGSDPSACVSCTYGKYQREAGASAGCVACEAGQYSNTMDATQCFSCPEGQFQQTSGSSNCTLCAVGQYQPYTGKDNCMKCDRGRFSAVEGAQGCAACPRGQYQDETGKQTCTRCSQGYFQALTETAVCNMCPIGQFSDTIGAGSCSPCPEGSFQDATGKAKCKLCAAGKFQSAHGQGGCVVCSAGRYINTNGATECLLCPAGRYHANSNSTKAVTKCHACSEGYFQTSTGSRTGCDKCQPGQYTDVESSQKCSLCPEGRHQRSASSIACDLCEPGFANAETGKASCRACSKGTFATLPGSLMCTNCSAGRVAATAGAALCVSCRPGKFRAKNNVACEECAVGFFSRTHGATVCMPCTEGTYAPQVGMPECKLCNAGYYSAQQATGQCTKCAKGRFSRVPGSKSCIDCYGGTFANATGSPQCLDCPVDTFSKRGSEICSKCPSGSVSVKGSPHCEPCPKGKYFDPEAPLLKCQSCRPGWFSSCKDATECDACEFGRYASESGLSQCVACERGRFADALNMTKCRVCGPGTYTTATAQSKCADCDAGQYNDGRYRDYYYLHGRNYSNGGAGVTKCTKCAPGKVSPSEGSSECTACRPGLYSGKSGQSSCDLCPAGKHQASENGWQCDACPAKSFSLLGSRNCTACKQGEVQPQNTNKCFRCLVGTYSSIPGEQISEGCHECPKGGFCGGGSMRLPRQGYWSALDKSKTRWHLVDGEIEFIKCRTTQACVGTIEANLRGALLAGDPQVHLRPNGSTTTSSSPLGGASFGGVVPGMTLSVGNEVVVVSPQAAIPCVDIKHKHACQHYDNTLSDAVQERMCKWDNKESACVSVASVNLTDPVYITHTNIPLVEYDGPSLDVTNIIMLPRGTDETAYQNCGRGYTGVKCAQCARDYFKGGNQCRQCPENLALSWLALIVGLLLSVLYVAIIIHSAVAMARDTADSFSVSLKILIGWFQMTALALSFDVPWPPALLGFLEVQNVASGFSDQTLPLLSVDCVLQAFVGPTVPIPLYVDLFFIILPLVFLLVAFLVWVSLYLYRLVSTRRTLDEHTEHLIAQAQARDKALSAMLTKDRAEWVVQDYADSGAHTVDEVDGPGVETKQPNQSDDKPGSSHGDDAANVMLSERVEFVHYMLERLDMGLQEYLIVDFDSQLFLESKERDRLVKVSDGTVSNQQSDWAALQPQQDSSSNGLYMARQKLRCKRYTTDLNSDADPVHLYGVDTDIPDPASRAFSEITRRRHLMQHMLALSDTSDSLEKLVPQIRTSILRGLLTDMLRKFVLSLFVCLFFFSPHLTKRAFELLACESVHNELRLFVDLDIVCDTSLSVYSPWYVVAWGTVLIGVIGMPVVALIELLRYRQYTRLFHTRHLLGFLFLGYEARFCWWEIVVIYRKALVYAVVVLLQTENLNLQMISALSLVVLSILVQSFCQPYENAYFDMLEQLGLGACASLFVMALYLHNVELFSNEWLGIIGTIVVIVVNLLFLLGWLKSALPYLCKKLNACRTKRHTECVRRISGYHAFIRPYQGGQSAQQNANPPLLPFKGYQVAPGPNDGATNNVGNIDAANDAYVQDVEVSTQVLNKTLAILEPQSTVYKVGDQVECRLEDDPTALSIFPSDRRIASMRNRWFKGSISAIHVEGNNMLDDDAVEEYVIAVELRSNKLDDMLSSLSALFRRCLSLFLCLLCRKKRKEFAKQWPTLSELMKLQNRGKKKKKKKTPNWKAARAEVAKRQVLKSMRDKLLQEIHEPDPSESRPRNRSAASVANVFETVAPMFNAVARAGNKIELQAARSKLQAQKDMLAEKKFELEATQIALRQAEEKLKSIPEVEDFPGSEGTQPNSDFEHDAQVIIETSEKRMSLGQIEIQRAGLHSRGRLKERLTQRRNSSSPAHKSGKSGGIRAALSHIAEESPNGGENGKLAKPTEKRGNAEILIVENTEKRGSIIKESVTDDSTSLRHHPKQPRRPSRTNTGTFEPDAKVQQQPRQRKKKKRTVKRALTSELKKFSESIKHTESFANRVAAKKVIERSKKELARANTILQAEKHRDHSKLMERVKRRHLTTAQSSRRHTTLGSHVPKISRRSSAVDRPTTSLS